MKALKLLNALLCLGLINLATLAAEAAERRVMILPFRNLTRAEADNWLGESFSESLLMGLGRVRSLKLVERAELAQVIKEQAFMQSLMADPDNAPRIGKLVGADFMITGSYQKIGERIQVNLRLVQVETGEIEAGTLTQVQGDIGHLFELQQNLADQLVDKLKVDRKEAEIKQMKASMAATRSTKAQEYYLKAKGNDDWLMGAQMMRASIENYQKALQEDPEYALAWAGLSERLAVRGVDKGNVYDSRQPDDLQKALNFADKALQLQPDLALAHRARARALQALKRSEEALLEAHKAVELENSSANIIWYLGVKYPDYNNPKEDMLALMQQELQALGADFDDPQIIGLLASQYIFKFISDPETDLSPAVAMLEKAHLKRPNYPPVLMLLASFKLMQQDFKSAGEYVDKILAIDPENTILMYIAANMLRFVDKERARNLALEALKRQPSLIYARLLLMEMYQQQFKDFQAVENEYRVALKQEPDNYRVEHTAGLVYFREKRYSQAIEILQRALDKSANQNDPEVQITRWVTLKLMGDSYTALKQDDAALAKYTEVLKEPDVSALSRAMTHQSLAYIFLRRQDYSTALQHFTEFMQGAPGYAKIDKNPTIYRLLYLLVQEQKSPSSAAALNDIGQGFLTLGEYPDAERYLNKALQAEPQNPVIHYNLGLYYLAIDKPADARQTFEKAVSLKPNYVKALYNLGLLAQKTGDKALARRYFEKVLQQEPGHLESQQALKALGL
ncbi:MAG: tetratricopeptide repeat protein [Candidatus Sericytochromatia bacterium]|nr:tetratricopeptide repeat protein [Candidatus Sericytochromatia bacterium]